MRYSVGRRATDAPAAAAQTSRPRQAHWFWHDRLLLGAVAICGLVICFQLSLTLAHPLWGAQVTDWLRAVLSWPELFVMVAVSVWLGRTHRSRAISWWLWSAALLSYVVARNLWSVYDQYLYHHGVPFPTVPDYFFMLQYPFFFAAVVLLPHTDRWGSRLLMILDGLIIMGAATAVSWYFILAPLYEQSGSPLTRAARLAYPVEDLFVLFGLTLTLLRPSRYGADRVVLTVLVAAVVSLITADSWASWFLLSPAHVYRTDNPPDLFWVSFYVLVPLAAVVQARVIQHQASWAPATPIKQRPQWQDFVASLILFVPLLVGLLASTAIVLRAAMTIEHMGWRGMIAPVAVGFGLMLLVILRQEVMFLDNVRLRNETEMARASELALIELNRRKDEFLGVVSHELRTPLTSLQGYIQLLAQRFDTWQTSAMGAEEIARGVARARTAIAYSEDSLRRITRLVDDLLDDARIRDGRLALHREPCDLAAIVRRAVGEQRATTPDRTIRLELPPTRPVPVVADAMRIGQVVTNYLTNALKYSKEDRPVEVRLELEGQSARVVVRDEGPGIPAAELDRVWERFHRIPGIEIQSGSGVGLGIGLHISRSIVEGHHGRVGVQSAPGHGSTFWFTLPLAR